MDPTELGNSWAAYGLFVFYLANGILILMLLRRRQESTAGFRLLVHAGDVAWPALISIFAEGPRTPFFLFFFFVLAAAAYRWGLWETLGTAAAEVALLWIESFVLIHVWLGPGGSATWRALLGLRVNAGTFEPQRLFMLSIYLLVMGLLLGYLAEQQKHLRAEKAVVTGTLSRVRVEAGLTGTIEQIFRDAMSRYGASRAVVASQESHSHRVFVGELSGENGRGTAEFRWLESGSRDATTYLEDFPGDVCFASIDGDRWKTLALDDGGHQVTVTNLAPISQLRQAQSFDSLVTVAFLFGSEWRGRVFLFNPSWRGEKQEELRFLAGSGASGRAGCLQRLSSAPVATAGGSSRTCTLCAGTARWRRAVADCGGNAGGCVAAAIGRRQANRIGIRPYSGTAARRSAEAAGTDAADESDRCGRATPARGFERHGGTISAGDRESARDSSPIWKSLDMPQRVCREILRIVQEGLVNVRKHSGARHALVRLASNPEKWSLIVGRRWQGISIRGPL